MLDRASLRQLPADRYRYTDFKPATVNIDYEDERRHFLELMEDCHGRTSTFITSQYPVSKWHDRVGGPTIADAILDRIVHNAHKILLKGESNRQTRSNLNQR